VRGNALSVVAVHEVTIVVTAPVITASWPQCHLDICHWCCPHSFPVLCHTQRTAAASVVLSVFRPSLVVCHPDVCKLHRCLGYICLAQRRGCVYTYLELVAREDTAPLRKACLRTVKRFIM